jgi:putative transposase
MARANRHYIPGSIWHITHRCHKQDFLLKFAMDRKRLVYWLFEAKKRHSLCILNYIVTSNHIHLLVVDTEKYAISRSIQLIAGRSAQEYNARKKRKGAFWEDRYHAVAVESEAHLFKCLVYIDLNMVRAGVVKHPSEWTFCGHNEIIRPRERYGLIDHKALLNFCGASSEESFRNQYRYRVEEALQNGRTAREARWTESIAVGSKGFVEGMKERMGTKAKGRQFQGTDDECSLREPETIYNTVFNHEKSLLRPENTFFWQDYNNNSTR